MKATALSRAEMEANHAREAARDGGGLPSAPPPANLSAVESLAEGEIFNHRGTLYWFRPVPYRAGLRHTAIMEHLHAAAGGDEEVDAAALVRECIALMHRYARPLTRLGWLPWWLRPNVFRDVTEREVGELQALFIAARMRSSVQSEGTTAPAGRRTSRTRWRSSSGRTRRG